MPDAADLERVTRDLFGEGIDGDGVAQLVAAPGGTTVNVDEDGSNLAVYSENPDLGLTMDRTFYKEGGDAIASHDNFRLAEDAEEGTGLRIFARAVFEYARRGVDRIETFAAGRFGDSKYNGYYTWARFGYNMEIPRDLRAKLKADGFDAKDIDQLFVVYGERGRKWWRENGHSGKMVFDVAEGSVSRVRLDEYLAEKGAKVE